MERMSTVEYDLDLSGGLMEEIQKLVAPPMSEEAQKRQRYRDRRREHRKGGRAVNHDCCDSCGEGGDLLCCDRCPAAFHLQCHDPPLEEDNVPEGEWLCHRCKALPPPSLDVEDDRSSTCSSHSRQSIPSRRGGAKTPLEDFERIWEEIKDEQDGCVNPLQILARAARMVNPKQFQVSKDAASHIQLPGSSKRRWPYREYRGAPKKLAHELDNGLVPLPAKVCFTCKKSCRRAPLIQCDYCSLLFHMDCLDPPLSTLPSGRWMCPNHVQHTLDEKLLASTRLSDRIKLWDKYTGPVDQQAIKVHFLKKIHRKNPLFRIKVHHPRQHKMKVPAAIKAQYANPPCLLPKAADSATTSSMVNRSASQWCTSPEEQEEWLSSVVSLQTGVARHLAQRQLGHDGSSKTPGNSTNLVGTKPTASVIPVKQENSSPAPCVSEKQENSHRDSDKNQTLVNGALGSPPQETVPNGPVSSAKPNGPISLLSGQHSLSGETEVMQTTSLGLKETIACGRVRNNSLSEGTSPGLSTVGVKVTVPCSNSSAQSNKNNVGSINRAGAFMNKIVPTHVVSSTKSAAVTATPVKSSGINATPTSILAPRVAIGSGVKVGPGTAKVTVVSGSSTTPGSKVITVTTPAQGKVGSLPAGNGGGVTKMITPASLSTSPAITHLNNTLQAFIEGTGDVELGKLDERLVQILAWQRLQQLLPPKSTATPPGTKRFSNGLLTGSGGLEVRARSLLCPLTGRGQPVPMPYRSLTIGTGADMDVCLNSFGHCNYVSPKHACIFYDETTRHYELLNYSEHGTTVDNVLYSCDFSEKVSNSPQPSSVVASVRKLISKTKIKEEPKSCEKTTMSSRSSETCRTCSCKASSSSLIGGSGAGWEGTALLHHGSYIKLGCLQFVFSIVEQAPRDPVLAQESHIFTDKRREGTSLLKAQLKSPAFS